MVMSRTPPEHGTNARYVAGCRCEKCRAAHAAQVRKNRRQKRARRPDLHAVPSVPGTDDVSGVSVPTLEVATGEAVAELEDGNAWTRAIVVAALRLAKEIDHPSTSMSVAPIVQQWRDLMDILQAKAGSNDRFGGLTQILGSR